jgi:hypothetical protein
VSTTHAAAVERLDLCDTVFRFGIRTTAYQVLGTRGGEIIPLHLNEYISSECRLSCRPSSQHHYLDISSTTSSHRRPAHPKTSQEPQLDLSQTPFVTPP